MNCPTCDTPLFGAKVCSCGFRANVDEATSVDITYAEGLAAFWRMYWVALLLATGLTYALGRFYDVAYGAGSAAALLARGPTQYVVQPLLLGLTTLLFVPRFMAHPFKGFVLVTVAANNRAEELNFRAQFLIWLFLYSRMLCAAVVTVFLLAPLNIFLSLFGVSAPTQVAFLATIFAVGPLLLKMLVGHEFSGFRIEVRRPESSPQAVTHS